jgi:hypothetical protein
MVQEIAKAFSLLLVLYLSSIEHLDQVLLGGSIPIIALAVVLLLAHGTRRHGTYVVLRF